MKYSNSNSEIKILVEENDFNTKVSVEDFGKGIPDEEKSNIFNQFYRIGSEDTRSSKGTGLGLYLVKELCDKLQIKISVLNNKPQGTIFMLKIPK